jgi:ABC-type antimicrobial peptide transport system permease subunit
VTGHTHRSARASRSWILGTTRDRLRAQWPLLLAVLAVAVLANTLITSLGLLVTATEAEGARGSFSAIPADQTAVGVRLVTLTVPVEEADTAVSAAVQTVLGPSVDASHTGVALTQVGLFPDDLPVPGAAYFGQLDEVQSHASLVSGRWASSGPDANGLIPVTIPVSAATALDLGLESSITVELTNELYTAKVVGIYEPDDDVDYWALDPLRGTGFDPTYPKPGLSFYTPITAIGPLITAPGALAAAAVPVGSLQLSYHPDFSGVAVDDLAPLLQRLRTAEIDIRIDSGRVSNELVYISDVKPVVSSITSGLVVTRSTVVVVSLLLLVLAIAAMAQTARLFTESRIGERRLMRSRGASGGHLLALTTVEAVLIGLLTTALSPALAAVVYRLIAAQPPMVAAGMPATARISATAWMTAAAVSLAFVIVLVAPLLARSRGASEEQPSARQSKTSAFMRSGIDVALIVVAALAYWQLLSYRGVLDDTASLTIDPILAVGPALVLLAGALLCVRLVPPVSRLLERLGSRSHRVVVPLASWELGRRPNRAVAAVLLLSLALAVGTFGLSFLETWRQSQLDQAAVAVGAPVRVSVDPEKVTSQSDALAVDTEGTPGAVFRRFGLLQLGLSESGPGSDGVAVQVLGLDEPARALVDRGRLAEVGGARIALLLNPPREGAVGIDLPADAAVLSSTARLTDASGELGDAVAALRVVIENADQLITTVDLGPVDVDGQEHAVTATLPGGDGLRVVGLQIAFDGRFGLGLPASSTATVTLSLADFTAAGVTLPAMPTDGVFVVNADRQGTPPTRSDPQADGQLALTMEVPAGLSSAFSLVGWKPQQAILALVPDELTSRYALQGGSLLSLATQAATVQLQLASSAQLVPGAADGDELDATGYGLGAGVSRATSIVVDQQSLARALAERGVAGAMVDEWWLDVAPGMGQAYVDAHPVEPGAVPVYSTDVLGASLQQAPLRVATQAALWVSIVAGALLAAVGFALHSAAMLRMRRIEFAQLRAIGLSRRALVGLVSVDSLLLCVLGIVFGVSIGILLTSLVGPLVAVSPDGSPPVPSVAIELPVASIGLLALSVVAVLTLVVVVVALTQRRVQPADLLRGGAQP